MKKNIKKAFIIIMAVIVIFVVCTACRGADDTDTENTTAEAASTIDTSTTEESTDPDMFVIDVGDLINYAADGKPIVEISCDEKDVYVSYDLSEIEDSVIEVTIEEELEKDDYFYVTMAGNVTDHTLMSDGALFDGVAEIEDSKAEFTVTYDDARTVRFVINIPNIAT